MLNNTLQLVNVIVCYPGVGGIKRKLTFRLGSSTISPADSFIFMLAGDCDCSKFSKEFNNPSLACFVESNKHEC